MNAQKVIPATLIPGDGIGPEITDATLKALDALGAPFVWDRQVAGAAGVAACGDPLPQACLDSIRQTRLALKGPLETPVGGGYRSSNVRLREEFKLYANLRPARTIVPGGRYENIDLVLQIYADEYKDKIAFEEIIVDACAMKLVMNPWQFDVLVTTNLFGDILSDEIAGLVGGLGMAPGANIGEHAAIFEAVHGSAPDIAGKGIANPIALMLAAGMMLDHIGRVDLGDRLRKAIDETLNVDQVRTGDLGGKASTGEFAAALVKRIQTTA